MSEYKYNEIRTKVKCPNADCYWNSGHDYCIKDEITITLGLLCDCFEIEDRKEKTDARP